MTPAFSTLRLRMPAISEVKTGSAGEIPRAVLTSLSNVASAKTTTLGVDVLLGVLVAVTVGVAVGVFVEVGVNVCVKLLVAVGVPVKVGLEV